MAKNASQTLKNPNASKSAKSLAASSLAQTNSDLATLIRT